MAFVALSAAASALAPALVVNLLQFLDISLAMLIGLAVAISAALGAMLYWGLVRAMWLPGLDAARGLLATIACALAASGVWWGINLAPFFADRFAAAGFLGDTLPVIVWWIVFSLFLWHAAHRIDDDRAV